MLMPSARTPEIAEGNVRMLFANCLFEATLCELASARCYPWVRGSPGRPGLNAAAESGGC
jgi:hypothetical protein